MSKSRENNGLGLSMIRKGFMYGYLILVFILSGCSPDLIRTVQPAATPQAGNGPLSPSSISPAPQSKIGNLSLPRTTIPVTWGDLHLTGTLVYTTSTQTQNFAIMNIKAVDLTKGDITTIFQAPTGGWIDFVGVSPDSKQLVMAYLPPRSSGSSTTNGQQALYTMPLDGSQPPKLLFSPPSINDQYFQPVWSPDSKYLYFTHVNYQAPPTIPGQRFPDYEVYRMAYPGGQPVKLADQAFWPRLSSDGARLAYVTLNQMDGTNRLFIANADGSGAYQVILTGLDVPPIIDAPFFTPDDQLLLYSAVTPMQSSRPTWVEKLLGVIVASAHTVPSDWWSIPLRGGTPTQLTHIAAVGLFASLSPDKKYIASYSGNGIFVMNSDGTGLNFLITDVGGQPGTVNWVP
jgi:Tol biopolymer transport system component